MIGAIPGPILFGALFDGTCLKWEGECGRQGNCWVYNNSLLSFYTMIMILPVLLVTSAMFLFSCLTYPRKAKSYELSNSDTREETMSSARKIWNVKFRKNKNNEDDEMSMMEVIEQT